jgi:hypothetical protein
VSTLYFETDQGDGFREPGFSKERWLEPQITIGLLTGQDRFSLMVSAFEGNKAETKTMLPVIQAFMAADRLPDVRTIQIQAGQHTITAAEPLPDDLRRALDAIKVRTDWPNSGSRVVAKHSIVAAMSCLRPGGPVGRAG